MKTFPVLVRFQYLLFDITTQSLLEQVHIVIIISKKWVDILFYPRSIMIIIRIASRVMDAELDSLTD